MRSIRPLMAAGAVRGDCTGKGIFITRAQPVLGGEALISFCDRPLEYTKPLEPTHYANCARNIVMLSASLNLLEPA